MIQLKLWSNAFFLLPLALALALRNWAMALFIAAVTISSMVYHLHDEKAGVVIDKIAALALISANLVLCALFGFAAPYFPLALLFVLVAFFAYVRAKEHAYDAYHALWHLASAAITTCCLLGYAAA